MKTIDSKIKENTSQHANQTNSQDFRFITQEYCVMYTFQCESTIYRIYRNSLLEVGAISEVKATAT